MHMHLSYGGIELQPYQHKIGWGSKIFFINVQNPQCTCIYVLKKMKLQIYLQVKK
jgi:hypothetical protein